jgi:glycosyltransferase involved in cell wall biosynthesis
VNFSTLSSGAHTKKYPFYLYPIMSLISVVIPAYKRGYVIERAIRSILGQTYQDFEILVVDDGSKDDTESVVASLSQEEPRIRYFCHDTNRGAQAARNTGAKAAQGEWIAFLDSDDYFTPNSLEVRMSTARNEGVKVVHSKCIAIKKDESMTTYGSPSLSGYVYRDLLTNPGLLFSGFLIAKEALEKIDYLDEQIISHQDWDTTIRLSKYYPFSFVAEPTFIYDCRGDDTISQDMVREAEGYRQVFNKHFFEIVKQLGPPIVAHHYRNIANLYQLAGNKNFARSYRVLSLLWWPFRFKAIYRKVRQFVQNSWDSYATHF